MKKKIIASVLLAVMLVALSAAAFADGYEAHVGKDAKYEHGCGQYLTFGAKGPASEYVRILIDGQAITAFAFEDKEGYARVDLKPQYVDTLSVGKHTAALEFTHGTSEVINFTVYRGDLDQYGMPVTGDAENAAVFAVLMVLSAAGMCLVSGKLRKEQ